MTAPRKRALGGALGATLLAALSPAANVRAAAPPADEVFALVVTNNRSTGLERPDLQYADDDGARYYRMFQGVARPPAVRLLTRFDRASAAAHPDLVAVAAPPRRRELLAALHELARQVGEARQRGLRTQFYFVYAGHGDVELGKGYLDLEDVRLDAAFLENEVVGRVAADVQHLVLDSCNSFFVVNPRKPGGRRWATPRDLALGFARRHPNVGLFLSTSTEAEVYEWSELESGIFSHEVRSGLSGAADVDGDGKVSYLELGGFVETANLHLARANLRPHIFFRGPAGDDGTALFAPVRARGRRLALGEGQRRAWIVGAAGERLIDLHKEAAPLSVVVPGDVEQPLSVVEWRPPPAPGTPPSLHQYQVGPGPAEVVLAGTTERPAVLGRGGPAVFADLWKAPFGARAFASWQQRRASAPEPVFGVSAADEARMRHYLTFIADTDRQAENGMSRSMIGAGALLTGAAAASYFARPRWEGAPRAAALVGGGGLLMMGLGLRLALTPSHGQQALASFEAELASTPESRARAVARTEAHLDAIARRERLALKAFAGVFGAFALGAATVTTVGLARGTLGRDQIGTIAGGYGAAALIGLMSLRFATMEGPTQRVLRLYREDPDLKLRFDVAPTPGGGLGLGLGGSF